MPICKLFITPRLDYGYIIFDKPFSNLLKQECIQYNVALSIAGALGESTRQFYLQLGIEYPESCKQY